MEITENAHHLHTEAIVIDGCSFFFEGYNQLLQDSGTTAINFTVPLPMDDYPQAVARIKEYYDVVRGDPNSEIVLSSSDIERCKKTGTFGVIIGCQSARLIGTDLGWLEVFHRLGLRTLQLTYNERNFVADGCMEPDDAGLSHFGRRVVKRANEVGLTIDLSHASVKTSLQAISLSDKPCMISHAGIREKVPGPRTIGNDVMIALAESGGVMGVTTHPNMNWAGQNRRPSLDDFLDNLEYAIAFMGIEHVALGTDYVAKPKGYPQWVKDYLANTYRPYQQALNGPTLASVMNGLDPREDQLEGFQGMHHLPRVTQGLLDRGYQHDDIKKVLGENFLCLFKETWR